MRLFLATSFPSAIIHDLNERVARVRSRLPAASWVREETQHVTFAFLGEQPLELIDKLAAPLTNALANVPKFEARLHDCGFFPNVRHARVGWVGLEPNANFHDVAHAVRDTVKRSGVELDGADFKPHLTLMRIRDPWPPASLDLFTRTLREYQSEPFTVEDVTLFSSQLSPKGAIHTPQRTFALA